MKIKLKESEFLTALKRVKLAVKRTTPMPILSGVLLNATDKLELVASSIDDSVKTTCPCDIEEPGKAVLPCDKLYQLINVLSEDIEISEPKPKKFIIKAGKKSCEMSGYDPKEFDSLSLFPVCDKGSVIIGQGELLAMLKRVLPAVSTDPGNHAYCGVLFEGSSKRIELTATMGHWMAHEARDIRCDDIRCTVHSQGASIVESLLAEGEATVLFGENTAQFILRTDSQQTTLSCKLIEERFPEYRLYIPTEFIHQVSFVREEMMNSAKCASVYEAITDAFYVFKFAGNTLELSKYHNELGQFNDTIAIEGMTPGEEFKIAFNIQYVMKALEGFKADKLYFRIKDNFAPMIVDDGSESYAMVCPVRSQ